MSKENLSSQIGAEFISAHHPDILRTKSKKELFRDVIEADTNGVQHDMVDYLDAFLHSEGYKLHVETGDKIDPDLPLVIAPNHHSRQRFFTTEESLRTVAIASVSARDHNVTDKHIAWLVRELPIPTVGIGKMARKVQNATGSVFNSVPAKTSRKFTFKGGVPAIKETMTREATNSLLSRVANRVRSGNALGVFPEQEPTWELKNHHPNFERNINNMKLLSPNYQIATLACFYEGKTAFAIYGPVVNVGLNSDASEIANLVMRGIAQGMPRDLRGPYSIPVRPTQQIFTENELTPIAEEQSLQ